MPSVYFRVQQLQVVSYNSRHFTKGMYSNPLYGALLISIINQEVPSHVARLMDEVLHIFYITSVH
jgi:hypothetical protein